MEKYKIHVVSTKKKSWIGAYFDERVGPVLYTVNNTIHSNEEWKAKQILITSREKICPKDWYLVKGKVKQCSSEGEVGRLTSTCEKIIISSEKLLISEKDRRSADSFDLEVYTDKTFVPELSRKSAEVCCELINRNIDECMIDSDFNVSKIKNVWSRDEVVSVVHEVLKATGRDIAAAMHNIGSDHAYIEFSGEDLKKWFNKNL